MVASFQCSWKEGEDPMGTLRPQRYGRSPPLPISLQYMPLARKTFVEFYAPHPLGQETTKVLRTAKRTAADLRAQAMNKNRYSEGKLP